MDWLVFNTTQKDSLNYYWYLNVWEIGDSSSNHANKLISIQKREENPSSSTSKQPFFLYSFPKCVWHFYNNNLYGQRVILQWVIGSLDENRFFGKKKAEECKAINDKIERALFRVDLLARPSFFKIIQFIQEK